MSIQTCIKRAADEKLGPLAQAVILNSDFSTFGSFTGPHFDMLAEELVETIVKASSYIIAEDGGPPISLKINSPEAARAFILMIQSAYGKAPAAAPPTNTFQGAKLVMPPQGAPSASVQIQSAYGKAPPQGAPSASVQMVPASDPNGLNSCYVRGCGQKFITFQEAMAHKCLVHGYNQGRWTLAWARDFMAAYGGSKVPATANVAASPGPDPDEEDPAKATLTVIPAMWKPTLNLDLNGLGLVTGEASRFAVGDDDNARFFFIRRLNNKTVIKGKFVWTKFAHYFRSENVYTDDFVVRKMAGDTKEWVGMQRKSGVWNNAYSYGNGEPKFVHEDIYVGEYENDLQEIMDNPHKARVRYGHLIGACGYCGRKLTDPESRRRGLGPDCWEEKYLPSLRRKP